MTPHDGSTTGRGARRRILPALGLALVMTACGDAPAGPAAAPVVAAVELSLNAAMLATGEDLTLRAAVRSGDGDTLTGRAVTWQTSAPAVATVDPAGRVTAVAPGTARVRAESGGRWAEAAVRVVPADAAELAGAWRMGSFDGNAVPATYAVFINVPVRDTVIAHVEIRLDSADMRIATDGWYQRRYCFTELQDHVPRFRYCWGDLGVATVGAGDERGRITLTSEYIQNLTAAGVVDGAVRLALTEPLWHGEPPRQTVWERQ